jgi:hypothetical protein
MNRIHIIALCGAALLMPASGAVADPSPALNSSSGIIALSSGIIALNSLPNPPATLATAKVTDAKGMPVGAVDKVVMDAAGKPLTVDVALLGSGAVVAIDAAKFNYDQGHNVLTAQMDAQQITQAPRAKGNQG